MESSISNLTWIKFWIFYFKRSFRISFNNNLSWIQSIFLNILIIDQSMQLCFLSKLPTFHWNIVWKLKYAFKWSHGLSVLIRQPLLIMKLPFHFNKLFPCSISAQIYFFIWIFDRIKNWEFDIKSFPLIIYFVVLDISIISSLIIG